MGLQPFVKEAWIEYAIGTLVVALRIYARVRKLGRIKRLQVDDYLMIFAWVVFTVEAAIWHELGKGSAIVTGPTTPPDVLEKARLAKKYNFAVWPVYITFIWSLKGCLLIFYNRLVGKTGLRKLIILAAWGIVLTYIGCILEVFLHCLPIRLTWISYPVSSRHCRAGIDNFLVVGLCNLLTDLVLLAIPIPVLFQLRIPLRRKIAISLLLCSGVFIIIATVLRNVSGYLITKNNNGNWDWNEVLGWAVRENFIALVVVNLPCIKPLFSSHQWVKITRLPTRGRSVDHSASNSGPKENKGSSGSNDISTSRSFFRRYSSKTLRTFGLTTLDKDGDDYMVTIREKRNSDESSKKGIPITIPKEAHIEDGSRSRDLESGLSSHHTSHPLTIHKVSEVDTQVDILQNRVPGESVKYPANYLLSENR